MKPYGVPRLKDTEWPDKADQRRFGLKGLKRHNASAKRQTRRILAKKARAFGIRQIRSEVDV